MALESNLTIDRTPGMGTHAPAQLIHAAAISGTQFPPLQLEARPTVDTAAAAHYLNRRPQTLRCWSVYQNGPLRPIRINGRLAWSTAEIRRLLGVAI
jgi:hypothetical protein